VLWIRGLRGRVRVRTIAAVFGISPSTVSEIQRGASWRWLPLSGEPRLRFELRQPNVGRSAKQLQQQQNDHQRDKHR
jgi:hypothetical protein